MEDIKREVENLKEVHKQFTGLPFLSEVRRPRGWEEPDRRGKWTWNKEEGEYEFVED